MARLGLRFLGPFEVTLDGKPITAFESNKVRALLAYLAVEARLPHRRESLAGLLWPDWPDQSAMRNLRYALADLRKNIADHSAQPPFLLISRDTIQFNRKSDAWVDVTACEEQLSAIGGQPSAIGDPQSTINDLESAIELYRGSFLEGFSLGDSPPFEEWVLQEREQLSRRMLKALSRLVDIYEQRGQYEQALPFIYRQLELEPWQEEAHQQLMRLLALSGQRSAALAQYEKCRRALATELGVDPGAETVALYEAIRDGTLAAEKPVVAIAAEPPLLEGKAQEPAPRHNLPRQLSRFIGREKEIAQIVEMVRSSALVTLNGSGGVGKTRLALAVAEKLLGEFPDGVWFVELAPLSDPQLVARTMANVLGVREEPERPILDTLTFYFRSRQALLVLDNCEHLIDACANLAISLLRSAPSLKMLASSREALGVPGEATFRVPSLSFPQPGQLPPLEQLPESEAIALFLDRACAVLPEFQITPENAAPLAQVCQRLDGIPLAIELAAARVASLDVTQIALRLDHDFRLLAGGSRAALERHRTLRAAIDWSYNLLSEQERLLLLRLSVFAGGCTLEAAEAVCSGEGLAEEDMLDLLSQLVNKSMLLVERQPGKELRYRLLETIRQYAAEKLYESGESESLHSRHLDYFLRLAEEVEPKTRGRDLVMWLDLLENELSNLRLALEWALQTNIEAELRLASSLMWLWHIHSHHRTEGIAWLEQGLAADELTRLSRAPGDQPDALTGRDRVRAKALGAAGFQLLMHWKMENAVVFLEESLELYRGLGSDNRWGIAFALWGLGNCALLRGDNAQAYAFANQSRVLFQEIGDKNRIGDCLYTMGECEQDSEQGEKICLEELAVQKEIGDIDGIATAVQQLGHMAFREGDYQQASTWYAESLERYHEVGNKWSVANQLHNMGVAACYQGDFQQATHRFEGALAIFRDVGANFQLAVCLFQRGFVSLAQGNYAESLQYVENTLSIGREIDNKEILAAALLAQSRMDWIQGENDQAAKRCEEALAISRESGIKWEISSALYRLGRVAMSRGDILLAGSHLKKCLQGYVKFNIWDDPFTPLEGLASLAILQGNMERATRLFSAVNRFNPGMVNCLSPIERVWREHDLTAARTALGEDIFMARWTEGRAMTGEQAFAYALEGTDV